MAKIELPKKYKSLEVEEKWGKVWKDSGVYHYDPSASRENTYVVDTPPPTVSGSLHVGHVFSYTQTDVVVRYQRMLGKNIFYPMGWDDNGLPTERRVQGLFGIKCLPTLPYDENFKPEIVPQKKGKRIVQKEISRQNFLETCEMQTGEDEKKYEQLWRHLGLSIDWNQQYETINKHSQTVSQNSFLDLNSKGFVYSIDSPTMWDTTFQTAVAQAEVEERERQSAYHDIVIASESGEEFVISTTRPELLPACVAIVAHPDDERYQKFFGSSAITPLFKSKVPILPAEHADPEKGTGILMVCTFGDVHDLDFWKKGNVPLKQIIGRDGKLMDIAFGEGVFVSEEPSAANQVMSQLKGLYVKQARRKICELLSEVGALKGDSKPTQQFVKYYEKGDEPLEYISTRQWFIKILENKEPLLAQGRKVVWHPSHMIKRFEQWVEGLNQDWCVSRQRFFGVPFPIWYPLNGEGEPDYENPIFAKKETLPVDPLADCPPGYTSQQRNQPGGFIGDPDVMDTWATSSCTPQISSHWGIDEKRHNSLFPADLRPQAHEIIRTWAFYTITKAWMHEEKIPWENIAISGWVVNPDREKMSKSKGNTVTPEDLITQYSADALRYWASKARLGTDTIYDENVFKVGQRLSTKIFNASKFVMMQLSDDSETTKDLSWDLSSIKEPVDLVWVSRMNQLLINAKKLFSEYDYAVALSQIETSFWEFCDLYVELVKTRAYKQKESAAGLSALATLEWTLQNFLQLFAPVLPYITEEVWSWHYAEKNGEASIHTSSWPTPIELAKIEISATNNEADLIGLTKEIMNAVRGEKSKAQKNLRWPVETISVCGEKPNLEKLKLVEEDLIQSCSLKNSIEYQEGQKAEDGHFSITVTLAETND